MIFTNMGQLNKTKDWSWTWRCLSAEDNQPINSNQLQNVLTTKMKLGKQCWQAKSTNFRHGNDWPMRKHRFTYASDGSSCWFPEANGSNHLLSYSLDRHDEHERHGTRNVNCSQAKLKGGWLVIVGYLMLFGCGSVHPPIINHCFPCSLLVAIGHKLDG